MKIVSVLSFSLIASFIYIKGQDSIKNRRIDHQPNVNKGQVVEVGKVDSLVVELNKATEELLRLQEEDKRYYQMELESDQMVINAQKELIITLLKKNESKGISE